MVVLPCSSSPMHWPFLFLGCVARPVFEVDLKSVELAGVLFREELSLKHNINGGFIVERIADDSALEHLGVRRGDVIFFEDECGTTLPEIEDYLLSLGWRYLQGMKSMVQVAST
ncbi:Os05g0157500 [Oryza sativa Japonica Group]|uniref:Os05g0157500 protein n=1 Tax=Oryza sativa subsp. japonica TaxID=39947 RepID=A0A0N7KK68_ORYSJ|nr:Os05g0157500 [Oryza sativa Japonica Group]